MQQVERMSYGRLAGYTALVLATLTIAYVTYRLGQVVLLFVISVLVAAALRAPMLRLQRHRVPRGGAILMLYLLIVAVVGALITLLGERLIAELRLAGQRFPMLYDSFIMRWSMSEQEWQRTVAGALPFTPDILASIEERGPQIASLVLGATYGAANVLISLAAILTLTFYWLIDEDRFIRLWLLLLPVQQRIVARNIWIDIEARVGTFVRSEAVQFVLTLVALWLGLSALGVQYPTSWAVYGALAQLIPWVGIPLTLLPVIPLLLTDSLTVALGAIVLIVALGVFMDRVVERRMGAVGIVHPILSILALMILGEVAGIFGMIVALPLAATLQAILHQLLQINTAVRTSSQAIYATQLQSLRARLTQLQELVPDEGERRMVLEAMMRRLDTLISKTEQEVMSRASEPELRRIAVNGSAIGATPSATRR